MRKARLRLRRARIRGLLRLHWEWIGTEPHVGVVRFAFVRPPEVADVALEPLGSYSRMHAHRHPRPSPARRRGCLGVDPCVFCPRQLTPKDLK